MASEPTKSHGYELIEDSPLLSMSDIIYERIMEMTRSGLPAKDAGCLSRNQRILHLLSSCSYIIRGIAAENFTNPRTTMRTFIWWRVESITDVCSLLQMVREILCCDASDDITTR